MRRLAFVAAGVVLSLAAALFLFDAGTFAYSLPDPVHGRASGCYTILDGLFGSSAPADALRWTEWGLVAVLLAGAWQSLKHGLASALPSAHRSAV